MTDKELMLKGELYIPARDPQLAKDCSRSRRITRMFNATTEEDAETREELIRELFGGTGNTFTSSRRFGVTTGLISTSGKIFIQILTVSFWMYARCILEIM